MNGFVIAGAEFEQDFEKFRHYKRDQFVNVEGFVSDEKLILTSISAYGTGH